MKTALPIRVREDPFSRAPLFPDRSKGNVYAVFAETGTAFRKYCIRKK
jgi:hypothetical protein